MREELDDAKADTDTEAEEEAGTAAHAEEQAEAGTGAEAHKTTIIAALHSVRRGAQKAVTIHVESMNA